MTETVLLNLDSVPRVAPGFRFQWEPVQDCHVLLYPEGMVKLNQSSGEIMKRCDGQRDVRAIVAELEAAFAATGLEGDVRAFVEMAGKQRWLVWVQGATPARPASPDAPSAQEQVT